MKYQHQKHMKYKDIFQKIIQKLTIHLIQI
jgi:hypothetical protein